MNNTWIGLIMLALVMGSLPTAAAEGQVQAGPFGWCSGLVDAACSVGENCPVGVCGSRLCLVWFNEECTVFMPDPW